MCVGICRDTEISGNILNSLVDYCVRNLHIVSDKHSCLSAVT